MKNKFPIYEEEDFVIEFHATREILPIYSAIILICKVNEKAVEEHILNPGFQKALKQKYKGEYFSVQNYTVKPYLVEVILQFNKLANNAQFELMFLETEKQQLRMNISSNYQKFPQFKLGTFNVSLLLHWNLKMIQKTLDFREDGILANSINILICRATGGFPFSPVRFIGIENLDQQRLVILNQSNEVHLTFHSKIKDHMKKIGCQAGNDVVNGMVKIFHHPTAVEFVPLIAGFVKNDSRILCSSKDGYPTPKTKWVWLSGPNNPQQYFTIHENLLRIHKNATLGSKWEFECISENTIPNSLKKGVAHKISFIIGEKPISLIVNVAIILSILLFILLFICAIYRLQNRKSVSTKIKSPDYSPIHASERIASSTETILENQSNKDLYPIHQV